MSGGSLDYVYSDIRRAKEEIEHGENLEGGSRGVNPEEVGWNCSEVLELFEDLAVLLRAYEWWDSGDTSEEKYREAEEAFLEKWPEFGGSE